MATCDVLNEVLAPPASVRAPLGQSVVRQLQRLRQPLRVVRDDAIHAVLDQLRGQPQVMRSVRVQRPGGRPVRRGGADRQSSRSHPPTCAPGGWPGCTTSTPAPAPRARLRTRGQVLTRRTPAVGREGVIIQVAVVAGPAQVARSGLARTRIHIQVPQGIEPQGQVGRHPVQPAQIPVRGAADAHAPPQRPDQSARGLPARRPPRGYTLSGQAEARPRSAHRQPAPRHRSGAPPARRSAYPASAGAVRARSRQSPRPPNPGRQSHPPESDRAGGRSSPSASGLMSTSTKRAPAVQTVAQAPERVWREPVAAARGVINQRRECHLKPPAAHRACCASTLDRRGCAPDSPDRRGSGGAAPHLQRCGADSAAR